MLNYLQKWIDQLRWQRLPSFQKLAEMLLKHLDGIVNYCRTKVRFGVVEALNGNIRMMINRGRGYESSRVLRCSGLVGDRSCETRRWSVAAQARATSDCCQPAHAGNCGAA